MYNILLFAKTAAAKIVNKGPCDVRSLSSYVD